MKIKKINKALGEDVGSAVRVSLDDGILLAQQVFEAGGDATFGLPGELIDCLTVISDRCESSSSAFTNILTGLAIKVALPDLDVRYHQVQIQEDSRLKKKWFAHRVVSETVVYPWLLENHFKGAKSGWQTRTFERPKPYTRAFDENISAVKREFLEIYESTEVLDLEVVRNQLAFLLLRQIQLRDSANIDLATPRIDDISTIIGHIRQHVRFKYSARGASRLPVLAIYATLQLVVDEVGRYKDLSLKDLGEHSAADSQTGAAGDIEFEDVGGKIVEAIEIKHDQVIKSALIADVEKKISPFQLDRYYVLTSSEDCSPSEEIMSQLAEVKQRIGCQVIVNGVFPTMQYYLRLVRSPQDFYHKYTSLLASDSSVYHEHRQAWNEIILGKT
tara:strand:+ start:1396 stop:2559 length:1164 start_codon:yes stop_codon:yes gene_type:complete